MKSCYECEVLKPLTEFYKHKGTPDGLDGYCKDCQKARQKSRREKRAGTVQVVPEGIVSKRCTRCKLHKPIDDFYKNRSGTWGLEARCKQCAKDNYRGINEAGIVDGVQLMGPARRCHLMKTYKMSLEEYLDRLTKQNGLCAICRREETIIKGGLRCNLSVDHDHVTMKNRDLLCDKCNRMLGSAEDNPDVLERAAQYLRRHDVGNPRDAGINNWANSLGTGEISC